MAEFMTQDDADKRYGKKGRTNAGLTLGIIGTALAALNNGGGDGCCCGGNNGGGILGRSIWKPWWRWMLLRSTASTTS